MQILRGLSNVADLDPPGSTSAGALARSGSGRQAAVPDSGAVAAWREELVRDAAGASPERQGQHHGLRLRPSTTACLSVLEPF